MLVDCLTKIGKQLSSIDRADIEDSYNRHLKTKPEYEAAISALTDFHKSLFDETNEFRAQVGLKPAEYSPVKLPQAAPEKGFEITNQNQPKTTGVEGIVKRERTDRRQAERENLTSDKTGLPNFKALEQARPRLDSDPNTELTYVDLDNFKSVNDKNSHAVGNQAIKDAGDILLKHAKNNSDQNQVFHVSGDEYVIASQKGSGQDILNKADAEFSQKRYGDVQSGMSGSTADTVKAADDALKVAKAERKRGNIPANETDNKTGNVDRGSAEPTTGTGQGASGTGEKGSGQAAPETKPSDTGQARVKSETIKPTGKVYTERGTEADIETRTIPRDKILTSLDEGYPAELQPRDRSRIASRDQISEISGKLNPELLGDSPKASDGRPLVVPVEHDGETKYAVVSGNGRTEAIRNAKGDASKAYDEFVKSKGGQPGDIYAGVLDPKTNLETFAREANESSTAKMSASEQAQADAKDLDLANFTPSDDGSIPERTANLSETLSVNFLHPSAAG
jgi:GGDEF domain-containing protein